METVVATLTEIPLRKYRFSSDPLNQASWGVVSTWEGDNLETVQHVDFSFTIFIVYGVFVDVKYLSREREIE